MKKILFTASSFSTQEIETLKSKGIEIIATGGNLSEEELIQQLQNCQGYICGGTDKATKKVIEQTNLEIIIFYGTGYESFIDVEFARKKGIIVANTPKANAYTVAEYTVALILNSVKKITSFNNATKQGKWERGRTWTLKGKTLGVIGLGTIGTYVAEIMKNAFAMKILYVSRSKKEFLEQKLAAKKVELTELMKEADVVTLHTPFNEETKNMIGEAQLNLMKPHAVLINAARAELVDGAALAKALKKGSLAAAAFDAYYKEPAPQIENDEWGLLSLPDEKFIITPHTAYNSREAFAAMNAMVIENLLAFIDDKVPPYAV